eukprot:CAMPEP_0176133068 /NCGR_PEP_ID=MMETSP0120_2-20121206/67438_1 /TAXON_ID=160619 /ORGANISM="Kryptoperidinium foliaceum, Strain CCMP 1326" /LENGTH=44 /DNA_ID= /DNA_START= /DNA_END= /DNA_ORIENTATION=
MAHSMASSNPRRHSMYFFTAPAVCPARSSLTAWRSAEAAAMARR